ncbi:acyl-CoA N-acyltransferase [Fennellomyces sp. T-0311]|nr:acyl-CoA N-acyltransferase [Fennellomyces sp. T-0311]
MNGTDTSFAIRPCIDSTEAKKYFYEWAVNELWDPGSDGLDIERVFYPCFSGGFFVGTVGEQGKEQVVSCVCAMKHGAVGYITFYIVDPRHRKKGYGLRTFQHALNYMSSCSWIGLCGVSTQVEAYKRSGFAVQAAVTRYAGGRIINDIQTPTVDLASVPIEQVIGLDKRYTGIYRPTFMTHWTRYHTTQKDCYGVAVVEQDQLVGFACMRRCVSGTYRIAPVYADTSDHAYALVAKLTQLLGDEDAQFATDVYMANTAAEDMFSSKLGWKLVPSMMAMYTMWRKGSEEESTEPPEGDPNGWYTEIG